MQRDLNTLRHFAKDLDLMLAVGCFIPFVLLAVGAGIGSYFGDVRGGYWGAAAGVAAGIVIVTAGFALFGRARRNE
jgi:hypothetical protein